MKKFPFILLLCITASAIAQFQQKPMLGVPISSTHPLGTGGGGLVAAWFFLEGSGNTVFDLSGNNSTGTEQQDSVWVPGKYGHARFFSGNDCITVPDNPSQDLTGPHTIIIYAKPSTLAADEYAFFIAKRGGSGGNYQAYARNDDTLGRRILSYWNGTTVIQAAAAADFVDNVWQQFGFVHDGTNINFYLDGILKDTQAEALGTAKRETLYINCDSGVAYGKSTIDHILIYNRALSPSEVDLLLREPFCMFVKDNIAMMAVEAPAPTGGQVIMITSLPWILSIPLLYGIAYLRTKYKEAA